MARALTSGGRQDPQAHDYAEQALEVLGETPAPWERKLLAELAAELGWSDPRFQAPAESPAQD